MSGGWMCACLCHQFIEANEQYHLASSVNEHEMCNYSYVDTLQMRRCDWTQCKSERKSVLLPCQWITVVVQKKLFATMWRKNAITFGFWKENVKKRKEFLQKKLEVLRLLNIFTFLVLSLHSANSVFFLSRLNWFPLFYDKVWWIIKIADEMNGRTMMRGQNVWVFLKERDGKFKTCVANANDSNDGWQLRHGSKEMLNQSFECNLTLWLRSIKNWMNSASQITALVCMMINWNPWNRLDAHSAHSSVHTQSHIFFFE